MSVAKRRRLEREQRRAHILEAAQQVFVEHGLAAATMEQVAAAAGLSKGTLYLYFHSKDELFMGLAVEILDAARAALEPIAADTAADGLSMFRTMATAYAGVAMSRPNTIRNALIWFASGDLVDTETEGFLAYRRRVDVIIGLLCGALERGKADGTIRRDLDPVLTMALFWPSLASAVVAANTTEELERRLERSFDPERLVPGIIDIFVRGIAACTEVGGKES